MDIRPLSSQSTLLRLCCNTGAGLCRFSTIRWLITRFCQRGLWKDTGRPRQSKKSPSPVQLCRSQQSGQRVSGLGVPISVALLDQLTLNFSTT